MLLVRSRSDPLTSTALFSTTTTVYTMLSEDRGDDGIEFVGYKYTSPRNGQHRLSGGQHDDLLALETILTITCRHHTPR